MQTASPIILVISLGSLVYFLSQYARKKAVTALLLIIVAALSVLCIRLWDIRQLFPYPKNYITRLYWLEGLDSTYENFDCATFIANAHGDHIGIAYWKENTTVVRTFPKQVNERLLQTGDVANFNGQHVAVYLGKGQWIDSDYRRGTVARFRLSDKPQDDPWFQGPVTIKRFRK